MIKSNDRSGWFGASDTSTIMGNWNTITFSGWWLIKRGLFQGTVKTRAMIAGSAYEHAILDYLDIRKYDRQIKIHSLRLRVNLDGETRDTVVEVKTTKNEPKVTKAYWQQAQVEMFATGKRLVVAFYRMTEEEYKNHYLPIEEDRVTLIPVEYDFRWIHEEYLPRLRYLAWCLRHKKTPSGERFERWLSAA